jgi:2'-5' RNA ligase
MSTISQNPTGQRRDPQSKSGQSSKYHQKPRPTHFLCFPLTTDDSVRQLSQSLAYFRSVTVPQSSADEQATPEPDLAALRDDTDDRKLRLLPEAAHRAPGTFHLTLGVMNLLKQEDMSKALALLQETEYRELLESALSTTDSITETPTVQGAGKQSEGTALTGTGEVHAKAVSKGLQESPPQQQLASLSREVSPPTLSSSSASRPKSSHLKTSLYGLDVFPKRSAARVFYAQAADPSSRLLKFANTIRQRFQEAGLINETRPLVLHATVANLIYVKGKGSGAKGQSGRGSRSARKSPTVDATEILAFFQSQDEPPISRELESSDFGFDTSQRPYLWATDIPVNRIRICKMGADKSETPGWGMEYPPIAEVTF